MVSELRQRHAREPLIDQKSGTTTKTTTSTINKTNRSSDLLGYRHWILIFSLIAAMYGLVVWLDHRLPAVVPSTSSPNVFSEERARVLLRQLSDLGPRISGSEACEIHAVRILTGRIERAMKTVEGIGVNRLEMDIQRPSGCFDLTFLSSFTLCYRNITNIIARIGPPVAAKHAILVNCHFDTLPDSPGATDDAISCASMMEVLDILANSTKPLENDIIFLFNGGTVFMGYDRFDCLLPAEENFLQASHGFITDHRWRHSIRAFINLEGTGAGGREILFQAGPSNSWLLKTYLDNAPHPHCSVLAQEIFQSGVVPSDTDFRVFRDYGRISGLDVAYFRNGWVYHTEFDLPQFIAPGSLQRAGENLLEVLKAMIRSPYLDHPGDYQHSRWVFYDVVGLFTVCYSADLGTVLNYIAVVLSILLVTYRIRYRTYTANDLFSAFIHHGLALTAMALTGGAMVGIVHLLDLVMVWYSMPEKVFPVYILPMLLTGLTIHSLIAARTSKVKNMALSQYDATLLIHAVFLAIMTFMGIASAFIFLIYLFFPMLRDPLLIVAERFGLLQKHNNQAMLAMQIVCVTPVMLFGSYAVKLVFDFFVPVMGRLGNAVNPELVMMPLSLATAVTIVLFTSNLSNLVYVSRRMGYLLKCGMAVFLLVLAILATTRFGEPYVYSEDAPRLRRIAALHSKRTLYGFDGQQQKTDNGLFVVAFDYRGTKDLPDHTFLQGSESPDCSRTSDEYCQLPYYTAIHELFPPEECRWVTLPTGPELPFPLRLEMVERKRIGTNQLKYTFIMHGGFDKASLHITPINGYELKQWSFTDFNVNTFGRRRTYFVFLTYGQPSGPYHFWILLENVNQTVSDPVLVPSLEISAATHYAHGKYHNSDTLRQLRLLIANRRKTPHAAVGWWKWAITMIGGGSEIISHFF